LFFLFSGNPVAAPGRQGWFIVTRSRFETDSLL
jgi:hypothetical protein